MGDDKGGTMRLGAYDAVLKAGSQVAEIYETTAISERHRHRYEVDIKYREKLEAEGLLFSGMSPDGRLPEIVECPEHPWYIGVQFHPELKIQTLCNPIPFSGTSCARRWSSRAWSDGGIALGGPRGFAPTGP